MNPLPNPPSPKSAMPVAPVPSVSSMVGQRDASLLEVLDRVLNKGVVLSGDVMLSVAEVDLVYLELRALLCSADTANRIKQTSPFPKRIQAAAQAVHRPVEAISLDDKPLLQLKNVSGESAEVSAELPAKVSAELAVRASVQPEARQDEPIVNVVNVEGAAAEKLKEISGVLPQRINMASGESDKGLAQLVLTVVELLRRLMEKQAMRRVESGTLSDVEIENLGETFERLETRMKEMLRTFGLEEKDLNINLGPLGDLM
ncbi:MAG: gas vesicle protein K [Rhizobacter sp.]|nr:gas vesicle protein K [Chlorobiales bacterium]